MMPMAEYQADPCPAPSLSSGIAKLLVTRSPAHAWAAHPRLNPEYREKESSAFDLGSAAHAMLLEGEDICVPLEFDDWRTKEAKARRDEVRAAGRIPLLQEQYARVRAMVGVVLPAWERNPDLSGYHLRDMLIEQSLFWTEAESTVWCRARPDALSKDRRLIVDYKTTQASANPSSWTRTAIGMQAEMQAAFYLRGNAATGGPEDARFVFVVQETDPPYAVSFCGVSPAMLAMGKAGVDQAIWTWHDCTTKNRWPSYPARICWIEPPPYAMAAFEQAQLEAEIAGHEYDPATLWEKP